MGFIANKLQGQQGGVFSRASQPTPQGAYTGASNVLGNFSEGAAKGLLSSIKGLGQVGTNMANAILPKSLEFPSKYLGDSKIFSEENLTPQGTAQNIGFGAERVSEFFLPAGKIAKASNYIDTLIAGGGLLKSLGRVLGKSGVETLATGSISLAQNQGNLKEAAKTGAVAGGLKGVLSTAGEVSKAFRLPEKMYSTIFKNTYQDIGQELKTGALKDLQKTDPQRFQRLVEAGIIKTGLKGTVVLDDTVAKQALDKGLKGSITNMAKVTSNDLLESEYKAQQIAKNFGGKIKVVELKKLSSLLNEISEDYANVGGDISTQASNFAKQVLKGEVDAETALKLRRFLDGMRIRSSFNPNVKLSQTQENFKYFADALRGQLAKNKEFAQTMKDYKFYIEAFDSLSKAAARQNNAQVLGLIDSILIGTGVASGNIGLGTGVFIGRKLIQNNATQIGQGLQNLGTSSRTGIGVRGILGSRVGQ